MKKPWLAFLLNFLFPGAGIAYLNKWGWAILNFVVVVVAAFLMGIVLAANMDSQGASSAIGPTSLVLSIISASIAMGVAQQMNLKERERSKAAIAPGSDAFWAGQMASPPVASPFPPAAFTQPAEYAVRVASAPDTAFQAPLPPPRATALKPSARVAYCGNCGAFVGDLRFCTQCGSQQAPAPIPVCSRCRTPFDPGTTFCGACGTRVPEATGL